MTKGYLHARVRAQTRLHLLPQTRQAHAVTHQLAVRQRVCGGRFQHGVNEVSEGPDEIAIAAAPAPHRLHLLLLQLHLLYVAVRAQVLDLHRRLRDVVASERLFRLLRRLGEL